MKAFVRHIILLSLILVSTGRIFAWEDLSDCDTTVWFVNIFPGSEIYELEGHSALRIKTCDDDVAINYGLFNFNSPNFVYRFVKGETDYMVGAHPWPYFLEEYKSANRRIEMHEIVLSAQQKSKLITLLKENLRPENRVYRYNYVLDNCATRPLRIIELAIGDTLILPEPSSTRNVSTFRNYMRYYHVNYPWYQFGIDLALGKGIDRKISVREKSFAPVELNEQIKGARVGSDKGPELIANSVIVNNVDGQSAVLGATRWYLTPLFWSFFLSALTIVYYTYKVLRRRDFPRLVTACLFFINGLAGLLITFLVFISVHEATSPNVNILWLNPLCFIPCITIWLKKFKNITSCYFLFNFVLLLLLIGLWICGYQSPNSAFIPLVIADMTISALYLYKNKICEKPNKNTKTNHQD